ncbi:FYVE, RhoGEF and PH domain-containing protein 6-like [Sphaerodactylus townsendi]|uniref:FYVE, RhoGEF and PH domain-containing protein 6-like n=1 Tax=Sphaerodactylus townsendi TaxID=933632 RepID=UPI0020268D10|nr:FYVE, RhoGEF and PH domain-containing protein 6-like [Sphaerodactylus townsendi]
MNSAEIKKPPVAPKPKFVVGHKLVPPPVAPKPDVVLGDILQPTKKTKPAIAPKPKVPKCSSFPDVKTAQPSLPKNSKSLETDQDNSSEYLVNLNYKNGAPSGNTAYIISVCSCNFECIHKYGNNTYNNSTIFEQLENLQNIDLGEKPASSLNPKTILDSHNEKFIHKNRVVLKTNFTEEKLKGVLTSSVPPNNGHVRQKPVNKLENNGIKIELTDFVQSSSSLEAITVSSNTHTNINEVIPEISETPLEKVDTDDLCPDIGSKEGDGSPASFGTEGVPSTKALPVPKPRKLRVPCLVRQAGIDLPVEGIKGLETSKCDSAGLSECGFRKTAKINVLVQSVSYNNQEMPVVHKSDITTSVAEKIYLANESSDSKELIPQNILSQVPNEISQPEENVRHSLDCSTVCSVQTVVDDTGILTASDNKTCFIRCNNFSMSLPKQLKLSCNQHLPAFNSLDSSQRKEDKDAHFKNESSLKIIPKKPQRHSLPAAGLLKKAASDECVEKRTCFLNEETLSETVLEGQRVRHLSAKVQSTLLSCGVPKSSLEKPIWKLPHPILPFSGSPEALKNTKSSKSNDLPCVVTKPRAKSLSSVDMDRINKPQRETQKKSSLKKFLNMKLSVCIIKSDFQRFLAKGSQSADNTAVTFSSREGCGKNWNVTCATSGKKTKPSKAHSIEKCSPPSQKGKQISRSRNEMPADQTPLSVDEQPSTLHGHLNSFSHDLTPEYENVSHYEAITDYENLSFALTEKNACFEWQNSSNIEDHDTSIYEVEEVYEATRSYSKFSR